MAEIAAKEELTHKDNFWDDPKEAEKLLKQISGIKSWVEDYDKAVADYDDLTVLYEFYTYDGDHARFPGDFGNAANNVRCRCYLTYRAMVV